DARASTPPPADARASTPPPADARASTPPRRSSIPPRISSIPPGLVPAGDSPSQRSEAFEVLGVPRTAPPPPDVVLPGEPDGDGGVKVFARAAMEAADDVELDMGDGDPLDLDGGQAQSAPDPMARAGVYSASGGVEVLGTAEPKPTRSERPDPRREGDAAPAVDVVGRVPIVQVEERVVQGTVPSESAPNVIVSMGDGVEAVVDDVVAASPDDAGIVDRVVGLGEAVLPVLVREFPGPLWFDRHRPFRRRPRGRDVSAIARCIVAFGEKAAPYVVSLLDVRDADARYYALLVAAEVPSASLVLPLGRRLFDEDEQVRELAIGVLRSLHRFDGEVADLLDRVRASAKVPRQTAERRAAAARALGELRDVKALELLVQLLRAQEAIIVSASHSALVLLTRQDFGNQAKAWLAWSKANRGRHRIEWLIDALLHGDELMRTAAADELKTLTQEYFGYHPALPKRDREIAQGKYREWWEREGRERFGG
ncbi:MAG: hypothetical protein AAGH15_26795, partial [Myxococcota bacterium]